MHRCRSGSRRARGRLDEGEPAARRRPVGAGRRLRDGGRRRSIRPVLAGDGRQGCVVVDAVPVIKVSRTKPLRRNSPKERTRPRPRAGRWWVRRKNIRGTVPPWQGLALREGLLRAHEAGLPEVQRLAAARRREAVPRSSTATVLGSRVSRKPAIWLLRRARRWDKPRWHSHRQGHGRSRLGVRKQGHRDQDPVHKVLQQGLPEREAAALIVRRSISLSGGQ